MTDFNEAKQKKERGYTVKEALSDASGAKDVIVVWLDEDGELSFSTSTHDEDAIKQLGMLEFAKGVIVSDLLE